MTTTRKANGAHHPAATADAGYLFRFPADKKGRKFLAQLRAHINRHDIERVRVLCNGPRKDAALADGYYARAYQSYLPQRHASEFRVYVDTKSRHDAWRVRWDHEREVQHLKDALTRSELLLSSAMRVAEERGEALTQMRAKYMAVPDWVARLCHALARKVR